MRLMSVVGKKSGTQGSSGREARSISLACALRPAIQNAAQQLVVGIVQMSLSTLPEISRKKAPRLRAKSAATSPVVTSNPRPRKCCLRLRRIT